MEQNTYLFFSTGRKGPDILVHVVTARNINEALKQVDYYPFCTQDLEPNNPDCSMRTHEDLVNASLDWFGLRGEPYWKSGNGDDQYGNFIVELTNNNMHTALYGYIEGSGHHFDWTDHVRTVPHGDY